MRRVTTNFTKIKSVVLFAWVALFTLTLFQKAQAQDRYAAFIHGFSFGAGECEKEDKGRRWDRSGTPQDWTSGTVDGYEILKYCDQDLYQNTSSAMEDLVDQMIDSRASSNARWVIVGHSQGGIVARLLREHIQDHTGIDVEGVMAIASPMQGARPAGVAYGNYSGHKNIKPTLDDFLNDVTDGPRVEAKTGWYNTLTFGYIGGKIDKEIKTVLYRERNEIFDKMVNGSTVNKNAKDFIGPGGELIEQINSSPNPDQYRALLGAERAPVAARVGSGFSLNGFDTDLGFSLFADFLAFDVGDYLVNDVLQLGLEGTVNLFKTIEDRSVDPGDESAATDFFDDVRDTYRDNADHYRFKRWFGITCLNGDCAAYNAWKRGREALQGFGQTHGELIDAFRLKEKVGERTVCPDGSGGTIGGRTVQAKFEPPSADEWVDHRLELPDDDGGGRGGQDDDDGSEGNECWSETYTYWVTVPDKNDGLLGVNYTTWSSDGNHSFLYNDRPSSYRRGGTGFNHAEMVYNKRRYDSSADPGVPNGAFDKGDPNPPMQDAQTWVENQVFSGF